MRGVSRDKVTLAVVMKRIRHVALAVRDDGTVSHERIGAQHDWKDVVPALVKLTHGLAWLTAARQYPEETEIIVVPKGPEGLPLYRCARWFYGRRFSATLFRAKDDSSVEMWSVLFYKKIAFWIFVIPPSAKSTDSDKP